MASGGHGRTWSSTRGDGHSLPFEDGEFEAATAMEVLEHVPDPDAVLGEMAACRPRAGCW